MKSIHPTTRILFVARIALTFVFAKVAAFAADSPGDLQRIQALGLASFQKPIVTYYSDGAKDRAEKIAADVAAMNDFYEKHLGIRAAVTLMVVNSNDWQRAQLSGPYGRPYSDTDAKPQFLVMPSQGGYVFEDIVANKKALPAEQLAAFQKQHKMTFEAIAEKQVEAIGFHELGHVLIKEYGIDER